LTAWSKAYLAVPESLPAKQPFWDRPGVLADRAVVQASLCSSFQRASFLAASSSHSGDWLFAMPIASCGLRLDDEAVRVGVGLRLGLNLCVPHQCHCGSLVDALVAHNFVCKRSPGRTSRHIALNDLVARAFASGGVPVTKEPHGLTRSDGKRPDGLTMVQWKEGKPLTWDVTVVCSLADSYVDASARDAGSAAESAAIRKVDKYSALQRTHFFQTIAVESLGATNTSAYLFLNELGLKISTVSGEEREGSYLFQRISVLVQRYSTVMLHESFSDDDRQDQWPLEY